MSAFQRWTVSEPYVDIAGTLLEGPFHDETRNEFRFVDIWEQKLYTLNLAEGPDSLRILDTSASIGVTANIANAGDSHKDQIVAAAKHGFALINRDTGELSYIRRAWDDPDRDHRMRFNDGAVDSHGRFWAGAMNDPKIQKPTNEGVLFRLDPDLKLHRMVEQLTIPNGIGWNPADDTMYLTDSPTGKIFAFDFDAKTGAISNRRVHFDIGEPKEPDGFAIDEEGCLWSAIYGGGKIIRISPEGKVIGEVILPTRNITCPTFVGTELFITTAKDDVNDEQLPNSIRYGGRLYRVDVGIRGKPKNQFRFQD
ncbi:SMP-30/gluconolactonase/LRE family protein [Aspergillus aculeatinus CBS 121060]|uniref:Calcium homeostasis protein Regucalcin n=1 Tax=Aspergillus aculeatinus CBS 121060 TaxID=1448322 RepID=A0ACD1HKM4_9EURO|nr:calcium homeostasis protein Regucalcin [Aspergillus aculeatinus CBS 121060]RAH74150.1 calcium homeostasis protein Regucalcin [Aspergillus aculeatinus CBS 121060]